MKGRSLAPHGSSTRLRPRLFVALAMLVFGCPALGVIVFRGDGRNLTVPGIFPDAWEMVGKWEHGGGVPVAPQWFLTVVHLGGAVGRDFCLAEKSYPTVEAVEIPGADLCLYRIEGRFPKWIKIWDASCGNELGRTALLAGRGRQRGEEIVLADGRRPGWKWGDADERLSWGTNVVESIFDAGEDFGQNLVWKWDGDGGADEATLASGDSGGALFLQTDIGDWRLAGMLCEVDIVKDCRDVKYNVIPESESGFFAAIHDARGLWKGLAGSQLSLEPLETTYPIPMTAAAVRLAPRADFIMAALEPSSPVAASHHPSIRFLTVRRVSMSLAGISFIFSTIALTVLRRRLRQSVLQKCFHRRTGLMQ